MTLWVKSFRHNAANTLTVWRIILAFIFVVLLLKNTFVSLCYASIVFLLAIATDFLDGWVARRWNTVSITGKLLDPLADKILVLCALGILTLMKDVPWWAFAVILAREMLITMVRWYASRRHIVIEASVQGKYKALWQYVLIGALLSFRILSYLVTVPSTQNVMLAVRRYAIGGLIAVTVFCTIASGMQYLYEHRKLFV